MPIANAYAYWRKSSIIVVLENDITIVDEVGVQWQYKQHM